MNLIVGASGFLGTEICLMLRQRGQQVRALVRPTTDPARRQTLADAGVQLVEGDLALPASLRAACSGVTNVISTATVVRSQLPNDNFDDVDDAGQRALVDAAHASGVRHFIFVSVSSNLDVPCPLIDAKRRVEKHIAGSGIGHTILCPSAFIEVWFGPLAGFDHEQRKGTLFGSGEQRLSYVSQSDVARFAVAATELSEPPNRRFDIGGAAPISAKDAVAVFEKYAGGSYEIQHVPIEALRAQYEGAQHPVQKSFAAIMLGLAADDVIPMQETARVFGVTPQSFSSVAAQMVQATSATAS